MELEHRIPSTIKNPRIRQWRDRKVEIATRKNCSMAYIGAISRLLLNGLVNDPSQFAEDVFWHRGRPGTSPTPAGDYEAVRRTITYLLDVRFTLRYPEIHGFSGSFRFSTSEDWGDDGLFPVKRSA